MSENRKAVIGNLYPHYTQKHFAKERTVWGDRQDGLDYVYSDRLWQWDWEKSRSAEEAATNSGAGKDTAAWYDAYLSAYFGKQVQVEHIMACFNVSNGYPLQVFGYREIETEK